MEEIFVKNFKKFLVLITMICALLGVSAVSASASTLPEIAIDGSAISIPASSGAPYIDANNRILAPVRVVAEQLGADVVWDENAQTVVINNTIRIPIGADTITTADGTVSIDTKAVIADGRTYIPLRAIVNALGYDITATDQNGTVIANITTPITQKPDGYVNPQWLESKLNDVTVIDVRTADEFAAGHIKGAINVYWTSLSNVAVKQGENGWAEVLDADALGQALGSYGIDGKTPIVIYNDPAAGWGEDGRMLWMLNVAGIKDVKILDGGYSAGVASGLNVTSEKAVVTPMDFVITNGDYDAQVDTEYVKANLDKIVLLDTRSKEEYNGEINSGEAAKGHIPGAVSLPYKNLLNPDGTILSQDKLNKLFIAVGLSVEDEIIVYCTGGVRAAFVAEVLEMCGYKNVKVYTAGFSEWAGDSNNAIE
jgi:thiosulfate/3-mercaptopyruvate sulfurtransferase